MTIHRLLAAAALLSALATPRPAPSAEGPPAPKKSAALLARGKESFETYCATCHGPRGRGDGEMAASLDPRPRDLVAGEYEYGTTPAKIFATISAGVAGTGMLAFGNLPVEERWALTYWVLELRGARGAKAAKPAPRAGQGTTGPARR